MTESYQVPIIFPIDGEPYAWVPEDGGSTEGRKGRVRMVCFQCNAPKGRPRQIAYRIFDFDALNLR